MGEFDPGPPQPFHDLFDAAPDYTPVREHFWFDWGPVFYRGRLDGTARVLCIASDPGPTERVVCRTLVGDAGQRVQGFLTKLGLTRSYICLNAFSYALFPSHGRSGRKILASPEQTTWRNRVFDAVKMPDLQAVVAFGAFAQQAVDLWPGAAGLKVAKVPHPSNRTSKTLLDEWRAQIIELRAVVTPDPDGDATVPNYGSTFSPQDYSRVPLRDLPFGVPSWMGDDTWGRTSSPRHNNSVKRPNPDDRHTLTWIAPTT